jgi:predicted phage terminase large subunit-like protein
VQPETEPITLSAYDAEIIRREDEINIELAERSLREYIKQAWDQVEPGRRLLWNWHIDVLADHLEAAVRGDLQKLLINIPPRFAKSLLVCVFFMTWVWIHQPRKRWMFSSYSLNFSKRDSVRCRRIIESPWYQARWGDRYQLTGDQNEKLKFDNNQTGFRLATSVGGTATGEGGDILVVDDPHKPDDIHSDTKRENDLTWWRETWSSRLNDEATGIKLVVMQRLHQMDLSGYLLDHEGGWEHVCLPLEYDDVRRTTIVMPEGYDPRTKPGELLFPERIGPKQLPEVQRRSGSYGYAGQYQQRPSPAEGGLFKRISWRFHKPDGKAAWGPAKRPKGCNDLPARTLPSALELQLISLDAAFKGGAKNDFVAFTIWGVLQADRFLLGRVKKRMTFSETIAEFRRLVEDYPLALIKLVEDAANGAAIVNTLQSEIPGIVLVKPEGGKEARAAAISPQIESGNVYLPEGADWVEDYIEEFSVFPNGANDDQVDSTSQALLYLGANPHIAAALAMAKD